MRSFVGPGKSPMDEGPPAAPFQTAGSDWLADAPNAVGRGTAAMLVRVKRGVPEMTHC